MSRNTKIPIGSDADNDKTTSVTNRFATPRKSKGDVIPEISPAPTGLTADSSFDTARSPGTTNNSVLTIEHKNVASNKSLIFGLSKPVFGLVAFLVLGAGGTFAYAISQWFRIPGLQNQIEELTIEVDRLESEVDRLTVQNDRLESLNDRLNSSLIEFEFLNDKLNASNVVFASLNIELNTTALELGARVEELQAQNDQFASLNSQLNTEVDRLENTNQQLLITSESLSEETSQLADSNEQLNETIGNLEVTLDGFELENNRLKELNTNLATVASFLNETASGLNATFDTLATFLADQITINRVLVLETLQNTYQQRLTSWDCDFKDAFRDRDFVNDGIIPVGADDYPAVVAYVDEQLLTELCLDQADFEQYLDSVVVQSNVVPPVSTSVNQLISGVQTYTNLAIDYYFPDNGDEPGGLTEENWSEASFSCDNLAVELRFSVGA
jgi:uncharacterized protein YlxW (UPF0749 family)